jgi:protoporphyrinogen oxidase
MEKKTAIIIGAGPAGLTAAYELLEKTGITPVIYEMTDMVGGICRTVDYKGNRIDIGGHRFFSKSDRVMRWWQNILPLQRVRPGIEKADGESFTPSQAIDGPDPDKVDRVMLVRKRISRIYYRRNFFNYPLSMDLSTVLNLGLLRTLRIGLSYLKSRIFRIREEKSLEDFFINRFGKELYRTFFEDYTEKVWGVPCREIKPEWGAQRIKGLSVSRAILHALKSIISRDSQIAQKSTETSLISLFMYPKFGPGQLWEEVARIVRDKGGEIHLGHEVIGLRKEGGRIVAAEVKNSATGHTEMKTGDYFFSTMPVKQLIQSLGDGVPTEVQRVARGLKYRDFITVGLLLKKFKRKNGNQNKRGSTVPDNWIYVQSRDVKLARLQIFNNWSPYLVRDPKGTVWVGAEYFCNRGDELWEKSDPEFSEFAAQELACIGMIDREDVLDSVIIRMPDTYPAYFGTYDQFDTIRTYTDGFGNLFLIGRNGMHRYNNQDHSMLTAMKAVENIAAGDRSKDAIWQVNAEETYHEEKEKQVG